MKYKIPLFTEVVIMLLTVQITQILAFFSSLVCWAFNQQASEVSKVLASPKISVISK